MSEERKIKFPKESSPDRVIEFVEMQRGPQGSQGPAGPVGPQGPMGPVGPTGPQGPMGPQGIPGQKGEDGTDGSPDTPDQVIDKINASNKQIQQDRIAGLSEFLMSAYRNARQGFGGFIETVIKAGTNITVTKDASGSWVISGSASGGGHTIQDEGTPLTQRTNLNFVGAGVTVTDDAGNNASVVTISTSAGAGYQAPLTGLVNGSNTTYTWAAAPNAISVDGTILRKTASDGTTNWTGTTTTALTIAPNFDVFGVA